MELSINNLSKSFGNLRAIDDVSMNITSDTIFGLIGPNGSGKTTLFNIITGFLSADSGKIVLAGRDITGKSSIAIAKSGLVRTFQLSRVFPNLTVLENLTVAVKDTSHTNRQKIEDVLSVVNLREFRNTAAGELSYGQKKQLEFARSLILNPSMLMLDEPMAGLEPALIQSMIDHIRYAHDAGMGIFIIEHHMESLMRLAEHIIVLNNGKKIAEGDPSEIQSDLAVIDAYLGKR